MRTRSRILVGLLLLAAFQRLPARAGTIYREPDAVLINIPEHDLNLILHQAFRSIGGPRFEGRKAKVSRSVKNLEYHVELSEPVLELGENGKVSLDLAIRHADLRIGRMERKIHGRLVSCENAGLTVDATHPVGVRLALQFLIVAGELRIVPQDVRVSDAHNIRLVRPSRCRRAPLPTSVLWWFAKARLRREIKHLDGILLGRAQQSAEKLDQEAGLLGKPWAIGSLGSQDHKESAYLAPQSVDTSRGSLFLSLEGSNSDQPRASSSPSSSSAPPSEPASLSRSLDWVSSRSDRPFVGISRSFLSAVLRSALSGAGEIPRRPRGDLTRIMKSSSIYTLIPGLRGVKNKENVFLTFAFSSAPEIEFETLSAPDSVPDPAGAETHQAEPRDRVVIRIHLSGIEMSVWEDQGDRNTLLGTLQIDGGTVGAVPYPNMLGGVSFQLVENEWSASSSGIEINDTLFAATLQELVFAEMFGTLSEPVWREGLAVGGSRPMAERFSTAGDYLVVDLAGF